MWECGLKQLQSYTIATVGWSLLMWECGLKLLAIGATKRIWSVTPYVGVWIETVSGWSERNRERVTPYVGVWIETVIPMFTKWLNLSHSLCGSVDWNHDPNPVTEPIGVTPYVGVWIETGILPGNYTRKLSLLMWECGLKQRVQRYPKEEKRRHSLCGSVDWNGRPNNCCPGFQVTPYVGVWIETSTVPEYEI